MTILVSVFITKRKSSAVCQTFLIRFACKIYHFIRSSVDISQIFFHIFFITSFGIKRENDTRNPLFCHTGYTACRHLIGSHCFLPVTAHDTLCQIFRKHKTTICLSFHHRTPHSFLRITKYKLQNTFCRLLFQSFCNLSAPCTIFHTYCHLHTARFFLFQHTDHSPQHRNKRQQCQVCRLSPQPFKQKLQPYAILPEPCAISISIRLSAQIVLHCPVSVLKFVALICPIQLPVRIALYSPVSVPKFVALICLIKLPAQIVLHRLDGLTGSVHAGFVLLHLFSP